MWRRAIIIYGSENLSSQRKAPGNPKSSLIRGGRIWDKKACVSYYHENGQNICHATSQQVLIVLSIITFENPFIDSHFPPLSIFVLNFSFQGLHGSIYCISFSQGKLLLKYTSSSVKISSTISSTFYHNQDAFTIFWTDCCSAWRDDQDRCGQESLCHYPLYRISIRSAASRCLTLRSSLTRTLVRDTSC